MARADWGKGKHQVFLLKKEICELLRNGENLERIYQHLIAERNFSIAPRTFQRHAAKMRDELCVSPSLQPIPSASEHLSGVTAHQSNLPADVTSGTTHLSAPSRPSTFDHSPEAGDEIIRAFFDGDK